MVNSQLYSICLEVKLSSVYNIEDRTRYYKISIPISDKEDTLSEKILSETIAKLVSDVKESIGCCEDKIKYELICS